nr:cyclase family protein [Microbacterium aurantiacum]
MPSTRRRDRSRRRARDGRRNVRDLSHPVRAGMTVYPGDPAVSSEEALTLSRDGVAVTSWHLGSHTGTHVDAPAHTVAGGRTMAEVALDELVGDAVVLRAPGLRAGQRYGLAELEAAGPLPADVPPIVIIDTGWAAHFAEDAAVRHPFLDPDAARELRARGMRVLAVDTLSPDPTEPATETFPVHEVVLGADGLIVENVCGLEGLPRLVRVGFFPLRIDGDGAPVRAVAFLP